MPFCLAGVARARLDLDASADRPASVNHSTLRRFGPSAHDIILRFVTVFVAVVKCDTFVACTCLCFYSATMPFCLAGVARGRLDPDATADRPASANHLSRIGPIARDIILRFV